MLPRMRLAWLLTVNGLVSGLFGIVALLLPGPLYDSFGGTSDVGSQFVVQLFGAALVGEALLRLGLRNVEPGRTRNVLTSALLGEYLLALVAALQAQLGGVTNASGWAIVVLLALFALGYAYFRFPGRAAA
jgi:hypothetical protein